MNIYAPHYHITTTFFCKEELVKNFISKYTYITLPLLLLLSTTSEPKESKNDKKSKTEEQFATHKKQKKSAKKVSYPHPGKQLKDMNEDELHDVLIYAKHIQNNDLAYKVFYLLSTVCLNHNTLKNYKLEFGDYCFEMQDFNKATAVYQDFFTQYPGSEQAEYAQYKAILSWFYLSLEPDRDQENTHITLKHIDSFLLKAKDQKFIEETTLIHKTCRRRLLDHEVFVFEHYVKQRKWTSAAQRLQYIKDHFQDIKYIDFYAQYLEKNLNAMKERGRIPFFYSINLKDAVIVHNDSVKKDAEQSIASKQNNSAHYFLA